MTLTPQLTQQMQNRKTTGAFQVTLPPQLKQQMQNCKTTAEFQAVVHANKATLPEWKLLSMVTFYNSQGEIV